MTTKVHIVNLGPAALNIKIVDPITKEELAHAAKVNTLWAGNSTDVYVHSGQGISVLEQE